MMDRVPYASLVGSLIFAMVCTRPDIAYSVGVLSRFMANQGKAHWEAAKWVLRYLGGTSGWTWTQILNPLLEKKWSGQKKGKKKLLS